MDYNNKKPRPPIEQLREAGKIATQLWKEKNNLPQASFIDFIEKKYPGLLPGLPSYFPPKQTLDISKRIMYDILRDWQDKNKNDKKKAENFVLFIEFCVKEINFYMDIAEKEKKFNKNMIDKMSEVPVVGEIFRPVNKYTYLGEIRTFFIDGFALASWIEKIDKTGEYVTWFLKWTDKLEKVWNEEFPKFVKNGGKE